MAWRITVDHFHEGRLCPSGTPSRVGFGEGDVSEFDQERIRFRLLGDGEVFYEGIVTDSHVTGDEREVLRPLQWGRYDAGCDLIQHFRDKKWQTL